MDALFGIAVVGVWIAISVVGLKRAYGSRGPSPDASSPSSKSRGSANTACDLGKGYNQPL